MTPPYWNNYHTNIEYNWTRSRGNGNNKIEVTRIHPLSPDDSTYSTDDSSDRTRVAAAVVYKEEEITIRLDDSASVVHAEMTPIRLALEDASETIDNITIHTYSLTSVNILHNRNMELNTITSAIRHAASILLQRPTISCIPAHTGIPDNEKADHNIGLQLDIIHTTVNASTFRV